jgi:hypothetical protein
MFSLLRNQSRSAAGAIWYVTIGTLMVIWSGLWYFFFLLPDSNPSPWQRFVCAGLILSGIAIGVIGLLFGPIGRSSKGADTTVGVATAEPMVTTPVLAPNVMPSTTTVLGGTDQVPVSTRQFNDPLYKPLS